MIKNKSQGLYPPPNPHDARHLQEYRDPYATRDLEDLYRNAFPQVARLLHNLGADLPTARDLFHDAMIIYLEKTNRHLLSEDTSNRHHLPENTSATQYLAGISKILWFKQCRQDKLRQEIHQMDHRPADPDTHQEQEKRFRLLRAFIKTSGESCIKLLQAFYYDQLPMAAIAEKFHYTSTHSATVQKYKCLEKLRGKLKTTELYEETIA